VQIFAELVLHDDKFQRKPYRAERGTVSPDERTVDVTPSEWIPSP